MRPRHRQSSNKRLVPFSLVLLLLLLFSSVLAMGFAGGPGQWAAAAHWPGPPAAHPASALAWGSLGGCDCRDEILQPTPPPHPRGLPVEELQQRLRDLGYYFGPINGIYGPDTWEAVRQFKTNLGLAPDAVVDQATWEALGYGIDLPMAKDPLPPPEEPITITIETERKRLLVYSQGDLYAEFPVAVGKPETPTPRGEWKIIYKGRDWGGGFGTRWLGLSVPWGIYGIHGTNKPWSVGTAASHGCIRMFNHQVEQLWEWVKVGTPVIIMGPPGFPDYWSFRTIEAKAVGPDVVEVQTRLRQEGLYWSWIDGSYGEATIRAVKYFQALRGLPVTGIVDRKTYQALGLKIIEWD